MSKNLKVLALKYRPQIFEDLIGQDTTVQTIYNSINLKKIPNAYLFTGIRGVGKTTIARIVAKALNCKNGIKNICKDDFCEHCNAIIDSNHIDVLEMDAASKTGVDDVRDLIEFSRYGPSIAKYKIFIIDEVHMLSKQAFNALLKTLEEPPEYLKFIFATTEIKKIPVTILSRCQRFDLPRVKSEELFQYIKKISKLENSKATDEAIKMIVKISEGSVRDALSLLDRGLISSKDKILDLEVAQKIFGYFDKNLLIKLIENLIKGNEKDVINAYRKIYEEGIEPRVFLNDFLEVLYYLKNISSIKLGGTNFLLNDEEFKLISELASLTQADTILLFWQFTIKAMQELDTVSNQNLSIEMFLIRLLYLIKINENENHENIKKESIEKNKILNDSEDQNLNTKQKTINQIKNFHQEEKLEKNNKISEKYEKNLIKNFDDLLLICNKKKELKLKYELETNVNLVRFENQLIEISFNENLDKYFVKELSEKLFQWTNQRWIISLSKEDGSPTKKQTEIIKRDNLINESKKSLTYRKVLELFPDAELINVEDQN